MAAFDAGAIEARLELNRDPFQAGIEQAKAEGRKLEDQRFEASAGLDNKQLQDQIDGAKAQLDRLKGDRSTVLIGADDAELERKITEAEAKLEELKRKEAEVGDTGRREFGTAAEQLGRIREEGDKTIGSLSEMRGRAVEGLDQIKGKSEEAAGGLDHVGRSASGAGGFTTAFGRSVQDAADKIPLLAAGGLFLSSALLPPLGLATEATLGMAGALTAAGVGVGAFGILAMPAFQGVGKEVQTVTQAQTALNNAVTAPQKLQALKQLQEAWAKIPPEQKPVVQGVLDLKTQLDDLSKSIRPQILDVFNSFLGAAHTLLPELVGPAKAAADALALLGGHLQQDFTSAGFHAFLGWVTGQTGPALLGISHAVGELAAGFGHLMMDSTPLIGSFVGGLQHITTEFNNWAVTKGPAEIEKLMDFVHQNAPEMRKLLDDAATAVSSLAHALSGVAGLNLQILDEIAKAINAIAHIPGIGPAAADITLLALALAKLGVLGPLVSGIQRIGGALLGIPVAAKGAASETEAAAGRMGAAGASAETSAGRFKGLGTALGGVSVAAAAGLFYLGQYKAAQDSISQSNEKVRQSVFPTITTMGQLNDAINQQNSIISANQEHFYRFDQALDGSDFQMKANRQSAQQMGQELKTAGDHAKILGFSMSLTGDQVLQMAQVSGVGIDGLARNWQGASDKIRANLDQIVSGVKQVDPAVRSMAILEEDVMNHMAGVTATAGQRIEDSVSTHFANIASAVGRNMNLSQTDTQGGTQAMLQIWTAFGNQQLANTTSWTRQMNDDFGNAMRVAQAEFASGGQLTVDALSTQLGIGKDALNRILNEFDLRFGATADGAADKGGKTGSNFGDTARASLQQRYGDFSSQVAAYDAALNSGLNQIQAAVAAYRSTAPNQMGPIPPGALGPGSPAQATGGWVDKMTHYIAGEAGPEAVISLDPVVRPQNIEYWKQAGKALGVMEFQQGGWTDPSQVPAPPNLMPDFGSIAASWGAVGNAALNFEFAQAKMEAAANGAAQRAAAAVSSAGGSPFGGGPIKDYMLAEVAKRWPGAAEAAAFDYVEMREAGYNPNAQNPTSSAAGLAQNIAGFGPGYERGNIQQQTAWMLNYIGGRYGDPIAAAAHERAFNWYGDRPVVFDRPSIIGVGEKGPEALVPLALDTARIFSGLAALPGGGAAGAFGAAMGSGPIMGGSMTYAPNNVIQVAGDLTREAVNPLLMGLEVLQQRDGAVMADLAARGFRFPSAIPGMT